MSPAAILIVAASRDWTGQESQNRHIPFL